jgi:hypothetical integral membrane protein (TIGR02206 family)
MNFFDYTSLEDEVFHGLTLFERFLPLLILSFIIFVIIKYAGNLKTQKFEPLIRYALGSLMLIGELSYMIWNYYHSQYGRVDFFSTLPFHLCSYAIWGLMFVTFTKSKKLYNTVFVFSVIGVLALLVPNLNHGFNSFRYYQLYISHSLLYITLIYLYKVLDYYPRKSDLKKSFLVLQVIIVLSLIVNIVFNSEFLFIGPGNKPIDFAWDWPWHMIQYEFIMFLFYTGTYFYLKNILHKDMD